MHPLGRSLLKLASKRIEGSVWHEIFFPKPMTEADREWKKYSDKCFDQAHENLPKLEKFINEVWWPASDEILKEAKTELTTGR